MTNLAMKQAFENANTMTVEAHEARHVELVERAEIIIDGIRRLEAAGDMAFDLEEWDIVNSATGESVMLEHEQPFDSYDDASWAISCAWLGVDDIDGDSRYEPIKRGHIQRSQWIRQARNKFDQTMKLIRDNKNRLAHARNMAQIG